MPDTGLGALARDVAFALPDGVACGYALGPARAPDIVFLHANGFNAGTYLEILAPVAATHAVLLIDLRGHGRSELPTVEQGHSWQVYAEDLRAVIAQLPAPPSVLAGHSMGAATCLLAAARMPAPPRLVLFDPVIATAGAYGLPPDYAAAMVQGALRRRSEFPSREAAFAAYRGRGAFATWPDATLAAYLRDGLRASPEGGFTLACAPAWEAANYAAFAQANPREALRTPGLRATILLAEGGSTCALRAEEFADGGMVTARAVPGSTHFLPMERPELVVETLR